MSNNRFNGVPHAGRNSRPESDTGAPNLSCSKSSGNNHWQLDDGAHVYWIDRTLASSTSIPQAGVPRESAQSLVPFQITSKASRSPSFGNGECGSVWYQ